MPSRALHDRAAERVRDAGAEVRLDRHQHRAVDAAERLADGVEARRVEVHGAVAVDVDAALDRAHQLHEVGDGLLEAVAHGDDLVRRQRLDALGRVDRRRCRPG